MRRSALITGGVWLGLVAPAVAQACAVCFSANKQTRWAYYGTTLFLIVVPAGIMGSIGMWIHRAARRSRLP